MTWFAEWLYEILVVVLVAALTLSILGAQSVPAASIAIALVLLLAVREARNLIPMRPDPTDEELQSLREAIEALKIEQGRLSTMVGLRPKKAE